ncbi:paraquat-inducible protein A [Vibrio proteolyticus]|uniref:Paraquat-inducible protein A n=1 Tax=Vibrio proteolyticus NBRC 13287 TaxID=1219065 RepID=U3BAV9_VIBPR|nr:paraquat-inducible protein A [Vibrio proteolyticus]GAD66924.1 paraquat-inducible protein A [Vibrio proteolyticus NBRC 13287]
MEGAQPIESPHKKIESTTSQHLIACEECGLVVDIPAVAAGQKAQCPRCHHTLLKQPTNPYQRPIAYAITCLITLILSVSFPFMSFSVKGLTQEITLLHSVKTLEQFQNSLLASLLLATVIVLPAIYICCLLYLHLKALHFRRHPPNPKQRHTTKLICRVLFQVEPWLMVDVFLIGVLVSLIKIASLADIGMGTSFWAFCVYTVLVVKCISMVDKSWLWDQFIPSIPVDHVCDGDSHLSANHVSCHVCHQINPLDEQRHSRCVRCGSRTHKYDPSGDLQKAWALLIASAIFYVPANLYPMMYTVSLGHSEGSTILGGVILLWQLGSYPIAMVIFLASIFIPLAKMFTLAWLFVTAKNMHKHPRQESITRLKAYRITEFIGRWSMIDIFVVAILVALVQLHNLMAIYPGPAALSFAAVVICTMLSAMVFDPRMLWQRMPTHAQQPIDLVNEKTNDE